MAIQTIYWLCLGIGLGFLVLSLALDDIFDFADVDIGGNDISVVPVFFAALGAFGGGGLVGIEGLGLATFGSVVLGILAGFGFGVLTVLLFVALSKAQAGKGFELGDLIGLRGQCSLALAPGQVGRITVRYEGMTRTITATSTETIRPGEEVLVRDVVGASVQVIRSDSLELPDR